MAVSRITKRRIIPTMSMVHSQTNMEMHSVQTFEKCVHNYSLSTFHEVLCMPFLSYLPIEEDTHTQAGTARSETFQMIPITHKTSNIYMYKYINSHTQKQTQVHIIMNIYDKFSLINY